MLPTRRAVLGSFLLLGACGTPAQPASLTPGEWTGDVRAPEVPAAIGLLARVPPSGAALNLIALEAMGVDGGLTERLRRRADMLAFRWRSEQRDCVLLEDAAGAFAGEWGVPPEPADWLREGIATFAGGTCAGYTLHDLAASLAASGRLLPLRTLISDFYDHDDVVIYLQSGSVFQYLHEQRGRAAAHAVWTGGLEPALEARRDTLEEFEAEWRAFIAGFQPDPDVDRSWRRHGCG